MTSMTEEERAALVAAMSNQTQMGRLTAGEISSCFDRLVEMGYDIVKRPAVAEDQLHHPAKQPELMIAKAKSKGDK